MNQEQKKFVRKLLVSICFILSANKNWILPLRSIQFKVGCMLLNDYKPKVKHNCWPKESIGEVLLNLKRRELFLSM